MTEELGGEPGGRAAVDVLGGACLQDCPLVHDHDPVAEAQRLVLVVGDEQRGQPEFALQPLEPGPGPLPQLGVEVGERLVEQQDRRGVDQRPGQGHPLLLAAGQFVGIASRIAGHLDEFEGLRDPAAQRILPHPPDLERERDVAEDRQVGPDRVGLEDHPEVPVLRLKEDLAAEVEEGPVPAGDRARVGPLEAGDGHQRGGLAAPAGPEEGQELLVPHREGDLVQRACAAECLAQALNGDLRHSAVLSAWSRTAARRWRSRRP